MKARAQISATVPPVTFQQFQEIAEALQCSQSQALIMLVVEKYTQLVERGVIVEEAKEAAATTSFE